jgi:peptide/nickel transport system substrate-binding protein
MAKKLLKEAGYPNGFSVTLTLPPYGYATSAGPLLQAELDAVGIKTTIKDVAFPLWISSVFLKSDFQLTIINHVEARDQGNYANCSYYWKYKDCAEVAKLLNAAQKATTTAEEISRYQGILKKITAAAVNDWLFNPDQLTIAKSDVVGIPGGISESFDLSHLSIGGSLSSSAKSEGYAS